MQKIDITIEGKYLLNFTVIYDKCSTLTVYKQHHYSPSV